MLLWRLERIHVPVSSRDPVCVTLLSFGCQLSCSTFTTQRCSGSGSGCMHGGLCGSSGMCTTCTTAATQTARCRRLHMAAAPRTRSGHADSDAFKFTLHDLQAPKICRRQICCQTCHRRPAWWAQAAAGTCRRPAPAQWLAASSEASSPGDVTDSNRIVWHCLRNSGVPRHYAKCVKRFKESSITVNPD